MDPITWLLVLGGGAYFLNKKTKSSTKELKSVPKEIKGFEISKNCNNIIVYDIKKARQWFLNSLIKDKLSAEDISKVMFENCKMDSILPTSKNYSFIYDIYSNFLNYVINKNPAFDEFLKYYVLLNVQYSNLTLILQNEDVDTSKFKKPITILNDKLRKELIARRSYNINDCVIEINDYLKMGLFARKVSKLIPSIQNNIDVAYNIFHNIIFDQCEEISDLSNLDEYSLVKEFFHGQFENGTVSLTEANMNLSGWIDEYELQGLSTEGLTPISPNI